MSRSSAAQAVSTSREEPTATLFKRDRPRHIDRFIDYFGGAEAAPAGDPCGEAFLDGFEDGGEP